MIIAEGEAKVTQGGHVIATLGRGDRWVRWPFSRTAASVVATQR